MNALFTQQMDNFVNWYVYAPTLIVVYTSIALVLVDLLSDKGEGVSIYIVQALKSAGTILVVIGVAMALDFVRDAVPVGDGWTVSAVSLYMTYGMYAYITSLRENKESSWPVHISSAIVSVVFMTVVMILSMGLSYVVMS